MGLLREEVQIETLRNWAAYSDELAEICDVISVSARLSYCQGEISSVRELVLWRPSDGSRDHHSSRYSRAGSKQMTEHSCKVLVGLKPQATATSRTRAQGARNICFERSILLLATHW